MIGASNQVPHRDSAAMAAITILIMPSLSRCCRYVTVTLLSMLAVTPVQSQQTSIPAGRAAGETTILPTPVDVDARVTAQQPVPASSLLPMGTATNPEGHSVTVNSLYLMRDGKPWLPVMGEFHFSRYPHEYWEEELLKMKAAGVQIVSTYIIWIHHEEVQGQFDWSGDRDLHEFVRLCGKHGLLVIVRIGPWAHAEVRNGGFPDWIQRMPHVRSNDKQYLAAVDTFYRQIAQQLKGQFWKDGGPVIGVQLENEYARQGPGQGAAHILKLKQLAVAAGFDVPLYTVTGWDGALFPPHEVLPVFGGYTDWPWDDSIEKLPPNEVYAFRFESREGGDMGAPGGRPASHATQTELAPYPFLSAEFGSGIEDTYHRRPVIHSSDVAAMLPTQLGSGVNLMGYYMFHGGANPKGKLTTLQESQATISPNDLPEISYDFQSPLGQYGEERESYRKIKIFHYFLNEFGDQLAPMVVHAPTKIPVSPGDFSVPRLAVRSRGDQAFLFVNNYVRGYQMPARTDFRARVRLPDADVMVPDQPITIPDGAYFIWPIGLTIQGATIRYATAQLITTLARERDNYIFFVAQDGVAPEFALSLQPGQSVERQSSQRRPSLGRSGESGVTIRPSPGTGIAFTVRSASAKPTHFVVLTQEQAERLAVLQIRGKKTLIYSGAYTFSDGDTVHLRSAGRSDIFFGVLGAGDTAWQCDTGLKPQPPEGVFQVYEATVASRTLPVEFAQTKQAGSAPPIERANPAGWRKQPVAVAPTGATMQQFAAQWAITLPKNALAGTEDVFLQIHYEGDVGHLYAGSASTGGVPIDDNFYNGEPWVIGLKRFAARLDSPLQLQVLPLRDDAPVYFDASYKPQFSGKQVAALASITAVPEYEVIISPQPKAAP
jgi:beta-galactosidase